MFQGKGKNFSFLNRKLSKNIKCYYFLVQKIMRYNCTMLSPFFKRMKKESSLSLTSENHQKVSKNKLQMKKTFCSWKWSKKFLRYSKMMRNCAFRTANEKAAMFIKKGCCRYVDDGSFYNPLVWVTFVYAFAREEA